MKNTVPSKVSLQCGRNHPLEDEFVGLDEAALEGTTRSNTRRAMLAAPQMSTRRHLGEQLGTVRLGGTRQRVRRRATGLEGALSNLAFATPSGERSIWPSGPWSLGRIGACRAATLLGQPSDRRALGRRDRAAVEKLWTADAAMENSRPVLGAEFPTPLPAHSFTTARALPEPWSELVPEAETTLNRTRLPRRQIQT